MAELRAEDLPRHLALFYESKSTQLDAVAAYIKHGLATDNKCLYLYDESNPADIKSALRATSVEVDERLGAGDLTFEDATTVYLEDGFDIERMVETLQLSSHDAVDSGYQGLFAAGENSWCFHADVEFDRILDFEAAFDEVCPDLPVTALCQYDLTSFDEETAAKALWTHQQVIYRNSVCDNPFYIPPAQYQQTAEPELNVQLMLEQAHSLTHSQEEIQRHQQRLEVLNRVLRHNIRNHLHVVLAGLNMLTDSAQLSPEFESHATTAREHAERIIRLSDQARYVEETLASTTVQPLSLTTVMDNITKSVRNEYPSAEVEVTGAERVRVLADASLDTAIAEAIKTGLRTHPADSPEIAITAEKHTQDRVHLTIQSPNMLKEVEREVLEQGSETELLHTRDLNLWLVKWVAENSNGSLRFAEDDEQADTVCLELPSSQS